MNTRSHLWQKPLVGFQLQKKCTTVLSVSLRWLRDRIRTRTQFGRGATCHSSRHSTEHVVEYLHNEPKAAIARRTSARHTRFAHPAHVADWPCAWPRHRQAHSTNVGRIAPGGNRLFVSCAASVGSQRVDRCFVGTVRQRKAGQVLQTDGTRAQTARQ